VGTVKDMRVTKKDAAGIVQEVTLKGSKGMQIFSGKKMYSLFKKIKSFSFSVAKRGNKITLKGKGYGHHLGLCQWGARELVKKGWPWRKILTFYYRGTTFMKLA
jgi:stage II sporulation protein D